MKSQAITKGLAALFSLCLLLFLTTANVFASGGDGSGGGNGSGGGDGGAKGLSLESSSPANQQTNIGINSTITLTFTNNVVNMAVANQNKEYISLVDDKGTQVPVKIQMADDQVSPDKKREIKMVPTNPLKKATTYYIKVDKNLQSKNGMRLGKPLQITFTTGTTSATKASSSGSSLPEMISIAAGLLIVAAVVIIVLRKRKQQAV